MVRTVDADERERHVIVLVDDNLARRPHVDRHFPATGLIGLVQNIAGTGRQRIGRERLLMRSPAISRSNWANDSKTLRVSRPIEVVVLNCWVTDTNDTSWASNSSISLAKSTSERVRRSTL